MNKKIIKLFNREIKTKEEVRQLVIDYQILLDKINISLQYVKEQTEEICLEAVKQNGDALQYVSEDMFKKEEIIEVNGKKYKLID